jgi:drug/metabolite transporter (DMT)-like permease
LTASLNALTGYLTAVTGQLPMAAASLPAWAGNSVILPAKLQPLSGNFAVGVAAALGAAVLYGSAPLAQAVASRRTPGGGIGFTLLVRVARQPIWLLGLSLEILGFLLEVWAFSAAPATLVAPIVACDMLVFVLLGSTVLRTRLSARGLAGAGAMMAGVGLLAYAFSSYNALGEPADNLELVEFLIGCVAVAGVAAVLGNRLLAAGRRPAAAAVFSAAAGIAYGLATMCTRQVGRTFSVHQPWHLLGTATPYALAGCSVLGIALSQRALQTNPITAFPLISATAAFMPVILGATLLDEPVPNGSLRLIFVAALVLLAIGVGLIAQDRSVAEAAAR